MMVWEWGLVGAAARPEGAVFMCKGSIFMEPGRTHKMVSGTIRVWSTD